MDALLHINSLVAKHVMGWPYWDYKDDYDGPYPMWTEMGDGSSLAVYDSPGPFGRAFSPATHATDTMEVISRIQSEGYTIRLWSVGAVREHYIEPRFYKNTTNRHVPLDGWVADFWRYVHKETGEVVPPREQQLYIHEEVGVKEGAPTFELTVCVAALKSVGVDVSLADIGLVQVQKEAK